MSEIVARLDRIEQQDGAPLGDAQADAFALEKYRADRAHELELNRIQSTLQVERLKVLQLLNGGGFAAAVTFSKAFGANSAHRWLVVLGAAAWIVGLIYAAWAMGQATQAQSKYTRAYRLRRDAFERERLGPPDSADDPCRTGVRWEKSGWWCLLRLFTEPPLRGDMEHENESYRIKQLHRLAYETHQNAKALAQHQRCLFAASISLFLIGGVSVGAGSFDPSAAPVKNAAVTADQ